MTELASDAILAVLIIFCRIGGCLMVVPGFATPRIPMQVRLFVAMAVTLALSPILMPTVKATGANPSLAILLPLMVLETIVGLMIGLMARAFFAALQFFASAVAMFAGVGGIFGTPIDDHEPAAPLTVLITTTATVMVFLTDRHWELLGALLDSYAAIPIQGTGEMQGRLVPVVDALSRSFYLCLQVASPFLIYSLLVNLMFGIANRLVQQIPVYFVSMPFVIAGGLLLLYFTMAELIRIFMAGYGDLLSGG